MSSSPGCGSQKKVTQEKQSLDYGEGATPKAEGRGLAPDFPGIPGTLDQIERGGSKENSSYGSDSEPNSTTLDRPQHLHTALQ